MVSLPFISFFLWSLRFYWIWWVVGLSLWIWSYVLVTWTNFCPISYINLDWNCDLSLCYFFLKFQLLHFVPWEIPLGRTHHQTGWVLTRVLTDGMESGAQTPALHPCEIHWKVYFINKLSHWNEWIIQNAIYDGIDGTAIGGPSIIIGITHFVSMRCVVIYETKEKANGEDWDFFKQNSC